MVEKSNVWSKLIKLAVFAGFVLIATQAATAADKSDIQCHDRDGIEDGLASIDYADTTDDNLWGNAWGWADAALGKCNLEGRQKKELAGEIRAHVIGKPVPGDFGPGDSIDMQYGEEAVSGGGGCWYFLCSSSGQGDPQEDKFWWLMGL